MVDCASSGGAFGFVGCMWINEWSLYTWGSIAGIISSNFIYVVYSNIDHNSITMSDKVTVGWSLLIQWGFSKFIQTVSNMEYD